MDYWFSLKSYIKHWFSARGVDSIHSPFVFGFYNEVLKNPYNFYAFEELENLREKLLVNRKKLSYQSLGAEKKTVNTSISRLAQKSLLPFEKAVFLFQLAFWLKPNSVLELGTCLGLSTAYLSKAFPSQIYTFEGVSQFADIARDLWDEAQVQNIHLLTGNIDQTLPPFLKTLTEPLDLVFVDANHTYEATVFYFNSIKPHLSNQACVVFDDIYWSEGMAKAWNQIVEDKQVTISIDLFYFGLVFFRRENQKEHFKIRW